MKSFTWHATIAGGAVALAFTGIAIAAKPKVGPPPPKLFAVIGPSTQLSFKDASGKSVTSLKTGWYTLQITDSNAARSFRLKGPGVDKQTGERFRGAAIWGVNLRKGTYRYESIGTKRLHRTFAVK